MFRDLMPRLSDAYHDIAPDNPGFGHSAVPDRSSFAYTVDHLADVVDGLLDQLGIAGTTLHTFPRTYVIRTRSRPPRPGRGTYGFHPMTAWADHGSGGSGGPRPSGCGRETLAATLPPTTSRRQGWRSRGCPGSSAAGPWSGSIPAAARTTSWPAGCIAPSA